MTSTKKVKLHPSHPYSKKRKLQEKQNHKAFASHQRNSALILSCIYLFGPLMVVPQLVQANTSRVLTPSIESLSVLDILNGRGGPEEPLLPEMPPAEMIDYIFQEEQSQYRITITGNVEPEPEPETSFTKVFNHMKVADTVLPTESPEITSDYGWRTPPCKGCSADHKGVDFVPGYGKPIFAVADGMVVDMGSNGGYGNYVRIQHLMGNTEGGVDEWTTLYAHMKNDSFPEELRIGSVVKSGETIGAVGNTGMSTGPHLHFELLINGEHVDPLPLLGTHQVIVVSEEEYPDFMFVGETFKSVTKIITYE